MDAPIVVKAIPTQMINERAAYAPFKLSDFINAADGSIVRYSAALQDGQSLPKGLICTSDGVLTGIPGRNTHGNHTVVVTAENEAGSVSAEFLLTIKPSLAVEGTDNYFDELKSQVWQAIDHHLAIPDLSSALFEHPITIYEIYYLLERWATLKIWDAFNLEPAGDIKLLQLEGASPHYNVYDRGSCLVASPKDLFSHERTIADGLQTARALAREVYKRNWTVELVGFDKLTRAAWVEIQQLGDKHGRALEVVNYHATFRDVKLYSSQSMGLESPGMD